MRLWDIKGLLVARNWVSNGLLKLRDSVLLFYRHFNHINTVGAKSCFAGRITTTFKSY